MKTITFALTFYKQSLIELERWLIIFNEIRKNDKTIDLVILNDNPRLSEPYFALAKSYGYDIPKTKVNKKKAALIRDAVVDGTIKGDYLKICDPDDFLDVERFFIFWDKVKTQKSLYINIFKTALTNNANILTDPEEVQLSGVLLNTFSVNYNTVYITEDLRNLDKNLSFTCMDDIFNVFVSTLKRRKIIYWENDYFYIWSEKNGVSHDTFVKKGRKKKILTDFSRYDEQMTFYKTALSFENFDNHYVTFGKWFIKSVQNSIIASEKVKGPISVVAAYKTFKFLRIYKKFYNETRKLTVFYKFSVCFMSFINKKI